MGMIVLLRGKHDCALVSIRIARPCGEQEVKSEDVLKLPPQLQIKFG